MSEADFRVNDSGQEVHTLQNINIIELETLQASLDRVKDVLHAEFFNMSTLELL